MAPVMCDESRESHSEACVGVARVWPVIGPHGNVCILPAAPVAGGLGAHGGIAIMEQPVICSDQVAIPFGRRYAVPEPAPLIWKVPAHVAGQPTHLALGGGHDAEQDHLGDAFGKAFGVG